MKKIVKDALSPAARRRGRHMFIVAVLIAAATLLSSCNDEWPTRTLPFLSLKYVCPTCLNMNNATDGEDYYRAIGLLPGYNLDAWKAQFGFGGGDEVRAIYGNLYDLRIPRDMHCRVEGSATACYVSNYGTSPAENYSWLPDADGCWEDSGAWCVKLAPLPYTSGPIGWPDHEFPSLSSGIEDAIHGGLPWATVAMVHDGTTSANNVKFYVFDENGALSPLAALEPWNQLDQERNVDVAKTVPEMCMGCHGGAYDARNSSVTGASFLPFNGAAFEYSNIPGFTQDEQKESIRQLNALVKATNPKQAIIDLIDNWYPSGVENPNAEADFRRALPGWAGHESLYSRVFVPYCQICHMAMPVTYDTYAAFNADKALIAEYVCDKGIMPHAYVPYVRFWAKDAPALNEFRKFAGKSESNCPS
jgi:hypothetical protein